MKENDTISRQAAIDEIRTMQTYKLSEDDDMLLVDQAEAMANLMVMPAAEPERNAPISEKEQLSLDCSFCREHECGDTLYESSDWDGGIGFDYIRNIRFCPICGRGLYDCE